MKKVITYQTPSGEKINLTPAQIRKLEAAAQWPKNSRGEEFCAVGRGPHYGAPSHMTELVSDLLAL